MALSNMEVMANVCSTAEEVRQRHVNASLIYS